MRASRITAGLTVVALLAGLGLYRYTVEGTDTTVRRPQPTETSLRQRSHALGGADRARLREERREYKAERKAWIDSLHRAAPGTDWRTRDRVNRLRLQDERLNRVRLEGVQALDRPVPLRDGQREVEGSWTERGSSNQAGRIRCAMLVDSTVWAASDGGIVWTGPLDGSNWVSLNDWLVMPDIVSIGRRAAREARPARLWVAHSGGRLFDFSDDEGQLWQHAQGLDDPEDWGGCIRAEALDAASDTLLLLAREWDYTNWVSRASLYTSRNGGVNFLRAHDCSCEPQLADIWSAGDGSGGFLLENLQCWAIAPSGELTALGQLPQNHSPSAVGRTHLRGRHTAQGVELFAALSLGNASILYHSTDGGQSWSQSGNAPTGTFMINSFGISALEGGPIWIGGVDAYRSEDAGANWTRPNIWWQYYDDPDNFLHADIPGLQAVPAPAGADWAEGVFISTDGGLYLSTDGLQSVKNLSLRGLNVSQYYGSYSHHQFPDIVYAGAQDQGFQRSTGDQGGLIAFDQLISGDYAQLVSGDGGNSLWCVYPGFVMHYPEATASEQALFWDFTTSGHYWLPPLMADPLDPTVVWMAGGGENGGTHLQRIQRVGNSLQHSEHPWNFANGNGGALSAMACAPDDPQRWYAMTGQGRFFSSADAGDSWTQSAGFDGPDAHYFHGNDIAVSPSEPGRLWVCGSGYDNPPVYTSADFGASFQPMDAGLPGTLVYALAVSDDGQWLFAASELGPWVWDAAEQSWQSIAGLAAPDQVYWNVEWIESRQTARFVTYGRGIWDFELTHSTSVDDRMPEQPASYQLSAGPNPFNPDTRIRYRLEAPGIVQLELYNLAGQRVRILEQGMRQAGEHSLLLNGSTLASGSYLLTLEGPQGRQTTRVTLLK
ncbi:MAG: T9SS type A sorting domain-containing protein [Candidatus Delongbacteria bacterium]|nr:T9SS type A sorting domain-containing protein [Candidatus Delongbacteria bacterium]